MSRFRWTFFCFLLASILCFASSVAHATTFTFTGGAGNVPAPNTGDPEAWGDPRNWSPNGVPGANDVAIINIPRMVDLGGISRSVQAITLDNGSQFGTGLENGRLDIVGPVASGTSRWISGGIRCTFNIAAGAKLNITGDLARAIVSATVNNSGTVSWSDQGSISCVGSPVFNNKSGGVFNVQGGSFYSPNTGTTTFNNQAGAVFNKSGAGTTTTFQSVTFNNAGTVNGLSGTLDMNGTGTSSGIFTAANGARVNVSGLLTATLNAASGGIIGLQNATLNTGTKCIGAGKSQAFNGKVIVNGTVTTGEAGGPGTLEINLGQGAVFTGTASGNLTCAGTGFYDWKIGVIGSFDSGGTINIANSGVFRISGDLNHAFVGATVNNSGIVNWLDDGSIQGINSSVFNNRTGGVFNAQSNSSYSHNNGTTTFNNQVGSVFNKSGAGTTTTFQSINFNNTGTVNGLSGTLDMDGAGASSGIFTAANGARVNVSGSLTATLNPAAGGIVGIQNATLNTGTKCIGAGKCQAFNGKITVNGTVTTGQSSGPGLLEINLGQGAVFTGTASGNLASAGTGFYDWKIGVIGSFDSGGTINIANSGIFRISGDLNHAFVGATVNNSGVVNWLDGGSIQGINSSVFNNRTGGVFNAQSSSSYSHSNGTTTFNNLAGSTFNRSGVGTATAFQSIDINNAGTINALSGTLDLSDSDFTQTGGATVINSSLLSLNALKIQGGILGGTGTVSATVNNSGGSLSPGLLAPGAFSETGAYTQGTSGTLLVQLNGTTPVTQYDQFNVTGTVALAGALNLSAGFAPPTGSTFTIINNDGADSITGTFANLPQGSTLQNGSSTFRIVYNGGDGNDVVLTNIKPTFAISDATIVEGSGGNKNLTFVVTLSEALTHTSTVSYLTVDNTAVAPGDYAAVPLTTLTFNPGQTSKTVTIGIKGDTQDENDETFFVDLKNPSGATIADARAIGQITDDDLPPSLSISDAPAVQEGGVAGGVPATTDAIFTVTLSTPSGKTVTVDYITANGTAASPADYTHKANKLTFAPGETSKTIAVSVRGDVIDESTETFAVNLSNPVNATLAAADASGTGTILDDDGPAIVINNPTAVTEGNSGTVNVVFTVLLSSASLENVTVQFATADFSATSGTDYVARTGTLTFAPGETAKTISVQVRGDTLSEGNEAFLVSLSNATNGVIADGIAAAFILDDDNAAQNRFQISGSDDDPSE